MEHLFTCKHAHVQRHWSGLTRVTFKTQEGVEVEQVHSSAIRAALALAKNGPCDCTIAWGKLRLLRKAPTTA